jgi:hypothetical protein
MLAAVLLFLPATSYAGVNPVVTNITIASSNSGTDNSQVVTATIYFDEDVELALGKDLDDLAAELKAEINAATNITTSTSPKALRVTDVADDYFVVEIYYNSPGMFAIQGANFSLYTLDASEELDSLVAVDDGAKAILLDTDFDDLIIDTGIRVVTLSTTPGTSLVNPSVQGQFTATPQVRGISWFQLLNDGELVSYGWDPVAEEYTYNWPVPATGSFPLHSHTFLTYLDDPGQYVSALKTAVDGSDYFGGATYELTIDPLDDTKFTITKTSGGDGETLTIRFFTYYNQLNP